MDVTGDPAAMRASAARLRLRAETVATVSARLSQHVDGMVYAGPAADRFRAAMTERNLRAQRVVARLTQLADTLTRSAAQVEEAQAEAQASGGVAG